MPSRSVGCMAGWRGCMSRRLAVHCLKCWTSFLHNFLYSNSRRRPCTESRPGLKITRRVLEVFADAGDFGLLVVQTRSPLVERDTDLLVRLGNRVWLSLTIETNRDDVRRQITPASPSIARRLLILERMKLAGIRVQAAISPVLPCDAEEFAELIASRATRAVVDTLIHGDGAGGRRSSELGMPQLLRSLGYENWLEENAHVPLLEALRDRMGVEHVGFSQQGFNLL